MTTLEGRPAPPDLAQTLRHAALEAAMVAFIEGRTEDARELLKRTKGPAARGTTPTYGLPWPILPDPPNVPADIQELAEATEAAIGRNTGWRNISSLLVNGWTVSSGYVYIMRAGSSVWLKLYGVTVPATWNLTVLNIPAGFQPSTTVTPVPIANAAGGAMIPANSGSIAATVTILGSTIAAGTVLRIFAILPTSDPWPATLPGTPV